MNTEIFIKIRLFPDFYLCSIRGSDLLQYDRSMAVMFLVLNILQYFISSLEYILFTQICFIVAQSQEYGATSEN